MGHYVDINIANGEICRVMPVSDNSFRVSYRSFGNFKESTLNRYGILRESTGNTAYSIDENEKEVVVRTSGASVAVERQTGCITLYDKKGKTLATTPVSPWSWEDRGFGIEFKLFEDEKLYGMGDVARDRLQKRGFMKKIWVTNVACYVPIPFIMSSCGWGILLNTTWKHFIDADSKNNDILRFWGEKGNLDFYLFTGDSYGELLDSYTDIAGKPMMLPIWAYGLTFVCNQQANARDMLDDCLNMRREGIPCDVIGLEPGWMSKYYDTSVEKNWHDERFYIPPWASKGPGTFFGAVERMGYKTSLWLCCDYDLSYEEERLAEGKFEKSENILNYLEDDFEKDNHFGHDACRMDKITKPEEPWFEHLKKFVDQGVSAFKLDGAFQVNEHPDRLYGNGMRDEEMHNLYSIILNKQMSLGFKEHTGRRAMIYSSGGYTGIQQFSATWAGDTGGRAKPLVSMLNHGMTGHSNTSCDMDVFTPEGIHFGFLQTWSQVCSWAYWRHPWLLGDKLLPIFRDYAKLRYRLLPYIYSMAHIAAESGMPVMRAMPLVYPDNPLADNLLCQYMFGDSFLVTVFTNRVYLPEGYWADYWTGKKYKGGSEIEYNYPEDKGGALFVKEGSIIPLWPEMDYVGQKSIESMEIHIYDGPKGDFVLYEDDGTTYKYLEGEISRTVICFINDSGEYKFKVEQKGSFEGMLQSRRFHISLFSDAKPVRIVLNDVDIDFTYDEEQKKAMFTVNTIQ